MSEILNGTEAALRLADSQDVSKMREFLLAEPQKPMLFVGNGGMQGHFASLLYEHYSGMAQSLTGKSAGEQLKVDLDPTHCYQYELNHSDGLLTPLSAIQHFLVLYGGYGAPAAHDIESVLAESGMASAQVTDYRNFCHGRFIFASNHTRHQKKSHSLAESDTAVILLVSPAEEKIATNIRKTVVKADWQVLPNETPIITIRTDYDDPLAAIDLHIKASAFLADLGENHHDNNPFSPKNYSSIRKEYPKNGLRW